MNIAAKERIFVDDTANILQCENNLVDLILADGRRFERLEPKRLFPVSNGDIYITLLSEQGKEIAVIRSLALLNAESRATVNTSLNDYYLVPTITRIVSVTEKYGTLHWVVQTDRGEIKFDIRDRNHDIRAYRNGMVRVRDSDDNRYLISNFDKLDKSSRRQLLPYI